MLAACPAALLTTVHVFSSISAQLGNPGQANYAAANAALDSVAASRQAGGLGISAVGWGPWGGAGMATQQPELLARLRRQGDSSAVGLALARCKKHSKWISRSQEGMQPASSLLLDKLWILHNHLSMLDDAASKCWAAWW